MDSASIWRKAILAPGNLISGLGHAISCVLLPSSCTICGSFLPTITQAPICQACWSEVPAQRTNCCSRCGEDLFEPARASAADGSECRACRLVPPHFVRAVSYGVYQGSMRLAIHALKFDGMAPVAKELGRRLASAIAQLAGQAPGQMLVVPVPLHRGKLKQRRFNQARTLATEALAALKKSHPGWDLELSQGALIRQRSTSSQAGLTARQRRQNLRGAFFVPDAETIRGQHILLVDDIYTSGATARASSRTLIEAGAASVWIATLTRAQRRVPVGIRKSSRYLKLSTLEASPSLSKAPTVH